MMNGAPNSSPGLVNPRPIKLVIHHPLLRAPIVYPLSSPHETFSSLSQVMIETEFFERYKLLPLLASLHSKKLTTYQFLFGSGRSIVVKPSWGEKAEDGCLDVNVTLRLFDTTESFSPHSSILSVATLEPPPEAGPTTLSMDVVCTAVGKFGEHPFPRVNKFTKLLKLEEDPEGRGYSSHEISDWNSDDEDCVIPKRWVYPMDEEESVMEGGEEVKGGEKTSANAKQAEESSGEDNEAVADSKAKAKPKKKANSGGKATQSAAPAETGAADSGKGEKSAKKSKKSVSSKVRDDIMEEAAALAKAEAAENVKGEKNGSLQDRDTIMEEAAALAKIEVAQNGKGSGDKTKSAKKGKKSGGEDDSDAKAISPKKSKSAKEDDKKKDTTKKSSKSSSKHDSTSKTPQSPKKNVGALVSNIELSPPRQHASNKESRMDEMVGKDLGKKANKKESKDGKKRGKHPPTLNEKDALVPAEQVEGFPDGWVRRRFPRSEGNHSDVKIYTPQMNIALRSKPEALNILAKLEEAGGDEAVAWHLVHDDKGAVNKATEKENKKKRRNHVADNDDGKEEEADGGNAEASPPPKKKGKSKSKAEVDPDKPKRPTSSFFLYSNSVRADVVAENPNWKVKEVATKIGEMWKSLDESKKKPFTEQYERELEEYMVKTQAYKARKRNEAVDATEKTASEEEAKAEVSTEEQPKLAGVVGVQLKLKKVSKSKSKK